MQGCYNVKILTDSYKNGEFTLLLQKVLIVLYYRDTDQTSTMLLIDKGCLLNGMGLYSSDLRFALSWFGDRAYLHVNDIMSGEWH